MEKGGCRGRVFPDGGHHEVWGDSDIEGLLAAFPCLTKFGVSDKQLIYKFDYEGVRFIFLWTGAYDYRDPTGWGSPRPPYEAQIEQMQKWLDEAKANGTKKAFISCQSPPFSPSPMRA